MNWKRWLKLLPILVVIALMVVAWNLGVTDYLDYELLKQHRELLLSFVERHYVWAVLIYIATYIVTIALSIPGAAILSILGGFLFAQPWGTVFVLIGATTGATCIFLAAKTALGASLREKAAPFLKKLEKGFNENAASYLLFLRFIPIFPFWLINIAPAFFNVQRTTFIWTTFVGIIPGTFVFVQAGTGLGAIFDTGAEFSIETIFNVQVQIALIALAIFSLVPIVVKKIIHKYKNNDR